MFMHELKFCLLNLVYIILLPHPFLQDKVSKVTVIGRSKVYGVADRYGVDVVKEEKQRRLRQHVQGKCWPP